MFWVIILVSVLVVGGMAVGFGALINKGQANQRRRTGRDDQMTALKASGALRHRKSNRP